MRLIASSLMAGVLALSAAAPAFADPPRYDRHDHRGHDRRDDRRDDRRYDRRDDRRDYRRDYRQDYRHDHWRRGDHFDYRRTRYVVVNDYHRYRLPPPRYGEYYARTDTGDIILIAAATGLVLWALNQ
jgi:Ni/Co efflux regulator RcnB